MTKIYKKHTGFSLIELMVVCLLISTLLAIGIPSYMNAKHNADKQKAIFNLYAIYQAQKMYYMDHEPQIYSFDISSLTADYAEISEDDGTWSYAIDNFGGTTFTARASHKLPDGTWDGYSIDINETGVIDTTNWPY